jgi:hypothetical protein
MTGVLSTHTKAQAEKAEAAAEQQEWLGLPERHNKRNGNTVVESY